LVRAQPRERNRASATARAQPRERNRASAAARSMTIAPVPAGVVTFGDHVRALPKASSASNGMHAREKATHASNFETCVKGCPNWRAQQ
jgi:hypothetical protein